MYRCYRLRLHSHMLFRGTEPLSRPESSQPIREGPRNRLRYSSGPIQSCAGSLFSVSPCLRGESSAFSTSRFVCAICDDVNFADGARSFFEADFLYEQMEKRLDPPLKK